MKGATFHADKVRACAYNLLGRESFHAWADAQSLVMEGWVHMNPLTVLRRARKWRRYPRLAIPVTKGPLLGFYHFLMGYFVPLYALRLKNPAISIEVLDCGPMNKWFDALPGPPVTISDPVEGLQTALRSTKRRGFDRGKRVTTFFDWDRYRHFDKRPIRTVARDIQSRFQGLAPEKKSRPLIVLAGRDHVPDELASHPTRLFGSAKRNIPNLAQLRDALREEFDVEVLDGSALTPAESIQLCLRADVLAGQHGAGLANALFCPPATRVVEILWDRGNKPANNHYRSLCAALNQQWSSHQLQDQQFSPVDSEELLAVIRGALNSEPRPAKKAVKVRADNLRRW